MYFKTLTRGWGRNNKFESIDFFHFDNDNFFVFKNLYYVNSQTLQIYIIKINTYKDFTNRLSLNLMNFFLMQYIKEIVEFELIELKKFHKLIAIT